MLFFSLCEEGKNTDRTWTGDELRVRARKITDYDVLHDGYEWENARVTTQQQQQNGKKNTSV
jgi:hypothetical protein